KGGLGHKSIETAAIERLKQYHWPGNVRELENMVRRLAALHPEDTLTADIVEAELAAAAPAPTVENGDAPKERRAGRRQRPRRRWRMARRPGSGRGWWSAISPATSPATGVSCRRPGSTTA